MKIINSAVFALGALLLPALSSPLQAKSLKDRLKKIAKEAAPIISVVAPGAGVVIKIIEGQKPVDAVKGVVNDNIKVVVTPAEIVVGLEEKVEDRLKKILGPDISKAIEVLQLPRKLERRLAMQGAYTIQHIIESGQLGDISGAPLAAALRQAKDLYSNRARPLPASVKILMSGTYDIVTLDAARYTVDNNVGSINGLINRIKESSGDNHAVVVDNIIVFAKQPDNSDAWFWGHEIHHTIQYKNLGIDGFAAKYMKNYSQIEKEADAAGDRALAAAQAIANYMYSQSPNVN